MLRPTSTCSHATSKNHIAPLHFRPLTTPSPGGEANRHHVHPLFGHPGPSVPTWQNPCKIFSAVGTSACWNTMLLVTFHPSRQSSSNTLRWWTSCATTSRPLRPGPSTPHRRCCQGWHKFRSTAGSCRDPFSLIFFHPTLLSSLKGPFKTRFSPQKRDFLRILHRGILNWCRFNGLPSIPKHQIQDSGQSLWSTHTSHITNHITRSHSTP